MIQLCFYTAGSIQLTLSYRNKHKDFYVMQTHHLITILLISVSYNFCQFRIGSMVLIIHDVSDIFLEAAKVNLYMGLNSTKNILFGLFAAVFFVSRLVVYPLRVLWPIIMLDQGFLDQKEVNRTFWFVLLGGLQVCFSNHN